MDDLIIKNLIKNLKIVGNLNYKPDQCNYHDSVALSVVMLRTSIKA